MPGLIIVEGSDAVGKTTAIRTALSTWAQGGRYLHCTRKNSPVAIQAHQFRMFLVALRYVLQGRWVFLDRWWPSDIVYSQAFGRAPASLDNCYFLDCMMRDLQLGGYVFCYDSEPQQTVARHARTSSVRVEMYDNIERVAEHYTEFCLGWRSIGHLWARDNSNRVCAFAPFEVASPASDFEIICKSLVPNNKSHLQHIAQFLKFSR